MNFFEFIIYVLYIMSINFVGEGKAIADIYDD